ncbi:MAG: choice-of-anchor K domain-containing protein [Verrucomicrobiales bacterium]
MKTKTVPKVGDGGLSLVQVLVALSILGMLAGVAVDAFSTAPQVMARQKITQDIRSINRAANVYRSFGGDLSSVSSPAEVLAKLQSRASAVNAEETPGLTGSLIDRRLEVEMVAENEINTDAERAVWDAQKRRFLLTREKVPGVLRFIVNGAHAGEPVVEETREQKFRLATTGTWIWDYGNSASSTSSAPTDIMAGAGGGGIPGTGGGGESWQDPNAQPLAPPNFSHAAGDYIITDYNLSVQLINPNQGAISRLIYRVDSGPWNVYLGTPVEIDPVSTITAYAESVAPQWLNSSVRENEYGVTPLKLDEPVILSSAQEFDLGANEHVTVTLANPNPDGISVMEYRVEEGGWNTYSEPLVLDAWDYPQGATVRGRAIAGQLYYLDSDVSSLPVAEVDPVVLESPTIQTSSGKFDYDANANVSVTLADLNSPGISSLEYRVGESPWTAYSAAFQVNVMEHQVSPAVIQARAVPEVQFYANSGVVAAAVLEPDPLFSISGNSDGLFANPEGPDGMVTNLDPGEESNTFNWGVGAYESDPSSLAFTGSDFEDVVQGERFLLGTLDYYNGMIWSGTGADSVELHFGLSFYDGTQDQAFNFGINLMNTVNSSDPVASADYVRVQDIYSDTTSTINGRNYRLRVEFGETTADGFATLDEFHVFEDASAIGWLYGTLWLDDGP